MIECLMNKRQDEQFSDRETAQRRDAVLKKMLATPPKPHSEMKLGKPRRKAQKSPEAEKEK